VRKWLPKSSLVATAEATISSRTASPPITASKSTSVTPAGVRVVKILLPMFTQKSARKRSLEPTRSVRACADSGAPSASRPLPSSAGSKKVVRLDLEDTLLLPPEAPQDDEDDQQQALELDELWSFVYRKSDKVWVWLALCRKTRQVVAFVAGDRSRATCRRLWQAIPEYYKRATCYSDFWEAYSGGDPG
jgi:IS1 transposase